MKLEDILKDNKEFKTKLTEVSEFEKQCLLKLQDDLKNDNELNLMKLTLTLKEGLERIEKNKDVNCADSMSSSLMQLNSEFESSSGETQQFNIFYRTFKKEFKNLLKNHIIKIEFNKGHFDLFGFFELKNKEIYYFSVGDVRFNKGSILIRTAKDFKDFTGGSNGGINLNKDFGENLFKYLKL